MKRFSTPVRTHSLKISQVPNYFFKICKSKHAFNFCLKNPCFSDPTSNGTFFNLTSEELLETTTIASAHNETVSKTILGMDEAKFNKWCVIMFFLLMMFMDTISATLNVLITMSYHGAMMAPSDDPEDPVEGGEASDQAAATPDFEQLNDNVIKGNVCHDEQSK